jgi:hypothetical protein
MATLDQAIPRIFRLAWRRYGKPFLMAVRPISAWNLPAGFAYDKNVDAIRNSAGVVITNHASYWVSDMVYILPSRSVASGEVAELRDLLVSGMIESGEVSVWVMQTDIVKLRVAHAIQLGDQWYDLESQQQMPSGYPDSTGLWARIRLKGRT